MATGVDKQLTAWLGQPCEATHLAFVFMCGSVHPCAVTPDKV